MGGYYFPMFVDISTKRILVIGGGKIAARRVRTLLKFAEHIEVTAPEICDEMKDILKEEEKKEVPQAVWSSRKVLEEDLKDTSDFLNGADIVLTATDDRELNQKIVSACRMRKILVNTADDKSLCDFYFPAVTEKDGVVIGRIPVGKARRRCVRSGNIWRNIAEILRDYVVGIYNLETIELFLFYQYNENNKTCWNL